MKPSDKRKKEIDLIVAGMKEAIEVSSMEELIEALGIDLRVIDSQSPILNGDYACYMDLVNKEIIYLSNECPEEIAAFTLAHEVGHAILHDVELAHCKQLFKSGTIEEEADYFATRLLNYDLEIIEGYTLEDYSKILGIKESAVKYII